MAPADGVADIRKRGASPKPTARIDKEDSTEGQKTVKDEAAQKKSPSASNRGGHPWLIIGVLLVGILIGGFAPTIADSILGDDDEGDEGPKVNEADAVTNFKMAGLMKMFGMNETELHNHEDPELLEAIHNPDFKVPKKKGKTTKATLMEKLRRVMQRLIDKMSEMSLQTIGIIYGAVVVSCMGAGYIASGLGQTKPVKAVVEKKD